MEGIHLRGGQIARGGIRWSDRMDYRTEVYGLMRAQLTKNAVIVPAGAKGGFIIKRVPAGRDELKAEVERQYKTYVRSLLDVTDNLVDGEVVHPPQVRALDGEDTYLVVAADKGTATFSDTANAISREYGFWLDDAFASGGSVGYDHKKLGITARGAWESVKRHFRELDMDPAVDEFTAVGIGDMSGDVFGNGMLLSDKIRLVAAYDHRHVFIDPSPDAAASFAERKRLFELPGSSWDDYDRDKLSEGGGVFPRTREVDRALAAGARGARHRRGARDADRPDPRDPARAGRPALERRHRHRRQGLRRDRRRRGRPLLGRDPRRRARAARAGRGGGRQPRLHAPRARRVLRSSGGRINADFIDNSAGVDCSDHEVNLKILLGLAEQRGEMTRPQRDELLEAVTEDVVAHVLYDSFLQAQIIGQEVERSAARLFAYDDLMGLLEEEGLLLNRASENLPDTEEIAERRRAGRGMERPGARRARRLRQALGGALAGGLEVHRRPVAGARPARLLPARGDRALLAPAGRAPAAPPAAVHGQLELGRQRARADVRLPGRRRARLRRRPTSCAPTGSRARSPGAAARWDAVEKLEGVEPEIQAELMAGVDAVVDSATRWYLSWEPEGDLATVIAAGRSGVERLTEALPGSAPRSAATRREADVDRLVGRGRAGRDRHRARAQRRARARARTWSRSPPPPAASSTTSPRSSSPSAASCGSTGSRPSSTEPARRLADAALGAARRPRGRHPGPPRARPDRPRRSRPAAAPAEAVERFLHTRDAATRRLAAFLRALSREGEPDLAGLTLAVRQLRAIVA